MKTCILIIGNSWTGKTSIIRALTGCGRSGLWNVKSKRGDSKKALVIMGSPQEINKKKHSPENFPKSLENKYDGDEYDIFICSLQTRPIDIKYGYDKYIESIDRRRFDVKVAVIEKDWEGRPNIRLHGIEDFCNDNRIPIIKIDASNDDHVEAGKIRREFYPK